MENRNTIIYGTKFDYGTSKVKHPEPYYDYKYEPEPEDTFMKCKTRDDAIKEWMKNKDENCVALYSGELPVDMSAQLLCEEGVVFQFIGVKIGDRRRFYLYPKTI